LPEVLDDDGEALLEIGGDQGESSLAAAAAILQGWPAEVSVDLAGLPRVLRLARR